MQLLRISRQTVTRYVKDGILEVVVLPNGRYEYKDESVYTLLHKGEERKTVIYARVSSEKDTIVLEEQIFRLKQFRKANHYQDGPVFFDIGNSLQYADRSAFIQLLKEIMTYKIARVIIETPDRLSRLDYPFLKELFSLFSCDIIVMNEQKSIQKDVQEFSEELKVFLNAYQIQTKQKKELISNYFDKLQKKNTAP